MSKQKMNQEEWDELWAEAREMGRIKCRLICMGETKNGMSKQKKLDQEEWDELWAVAREIGRIEDRRICTGNEAGGEVHQINLCQKVIGNA